jgi:hypothetical protein
MVNNWLSRCLATTQKNGTQATVHTLVQFLNYCTTLRYYASDMILITHSDASYLNVDRASSHVGGHHFLGDNAPPEFQPGNGAILDIARILKHVASSAAEAEVGATFVNVKEAVVIRTTLDEMGHPQPATPLQVDNTTACGILNGTVKQERSRAMDMRFYWIRDRTQQGQFKVFWAPGICNRADYFTKHHSPAHHRLMCPRYLHEPDSIQSSLQQGCVKSLSRKPKGTWKHVLMPTGLRTTSLVRWSPVYYTGTKTVMIITE